MSKKIPVEQLADSIMDTLLDYAEAGAKETKQAVIDTAEAVRGRISTTSPKDTGAYSQSWAVKKQRETTKDLTLVVHSKNCYRLTHLLEFGHAKRNGGRVPAQPHIRPAEEYGISELEERIWKAWEE